MRRVLALGLTAALFLGLAGTGRAEAVRPAGAKAARTDSAGTSHQGIVLARVPLILIHGLGGGGDAFQAPLGMGLEQRFIQAGYRKGTDLFVLDYADDSNGDYVHVAHEHLHPLVAQVRKATGAGQVDLLGYSMGGLVARYYLNLPGQAALVRTVVLLASPAHGSFAADIVKDAEVTSAYLEERGESPPNADRVSAQQRYVSEVAREIFEPRLLRYLSEGKLARHAAVLLDFLAWLDQHWPGEGDRLFEDAQAPPGATRVSAAGGLARPHVGMDLTAAYLHALALHAAKAHVQKAMQGGQRAAVEPSMNERLTATLERVTKWLGIEPQGFAIDRLLAERFLLESRQDYLANYFLDGWNRVDAKRRLGAEPDDPAAPRYVLVAGSMANLYKLWWPAVEANDGAVEVRSAWLPLGLRDAFHVVEGSAAAASHVALKLNPQVFAQILEQLAPSGPAPARRLSPLVRRWWWKDLAWEQSGRLQIARWAPVYVDVDAARLKGRTGSLTIEVQAGADVLSRLWGAVTRNPAGHRPTEAPLVWVEPLTGPKSGAPALIPMRRKGTRWEGALTVEGFGGDVTGARIGLRLDGRAESLPENDYLQVSYRVRFKPVTNDPTLADPGRSGTSGRTPEDGTNGVTGVHAPDDNGASAAGGERGGGAQGDGAEMNDPHVPTIWVKRGTRETTNRDVAREGHAYWEWDFGDGTSQRDEDPDHLQGDMEHRFPAPGLYHVTATSVSSSGQELRRLTWDVSVAQPGAEAGAEAGAGEGGAGSLLDAAALLQRFRFETIRPPWVRIHLEGPIKWVTRRPARYHVSVETLPVPWVERQKVTVDPARDFQVAWEKPGTYVVRAAVTLETTYRLPEGGRITLRNTYIESKQVKVFTPALTDM